MTPAIALTQREKDEELLGAAMIAHEAGIDRSYLHLSRSMSQPFPMRRRQAMDVIRHINSLPAGMMFTIPHITIGKRHTTGTVENVFRQLVACNGITLLRRKTPAPNSDKHNRFTYQIGDANRLVIEEILGD